MNPEACNFHTAGQIIGCCCIIKKTTGAGISSVAPALATVIVAVLVDPLIVYSTSTVIGYETVPV